jgi:hypothetical protein
MSLTADIRNYTVSLITNAGIAGGNVKNSPVIPTFLKSTPLVAVHSDKVQGAHQSIHKLSFTENITLAIDCFVGLTASWMDDADALADAVLQLLFTDATWIGSFTHMPSYQVDFISLGDLQSPVGVATITVIGQRYKVYSN